LERVALLPAIRRPHRCSTGVVQWPRHVATCPPPSLSSHDLVRFCCQRDELQVTRRTARFLVRTISSLAINERELLPSAKGKNHELVVLRQ
jgi:hypothetical protein